MSLVAVVAGTVYPPIAHIPGCGAPGGKRNIRQHEHDNELNPRNNTRGFILLSKLPQDVVARLVAYLRANACAPTVYLLNSRLVLRQFSLQNPAIVYPPYRRRLEKSYFSLQNHVHTYRAYLRL